jgi:transporter family-2 protein
MGLAALLGGVLNTVQAGSNATLAKVLGQPILAALTVTVLNAILYLAVAPFVGVALPRSGAVASVPWWAWLGGLFGAVYVLVSIFFAEKLGAAIFIGLTVTAGIVTSVAMDHYGLVGFKQHAANWPRLLGAAIMIGGLALVCIF